MVKKNLKEQIFICLIWLSIITTSWELCEVCQSQNKVACHNETTYSVCLKDVPTLDYITCPTNYICTTDARICIPKEQATPSCIPNADVKSQCGICSIPNRVFSCINETTIAFCFGNNEPDFEAIAYCPEQTVCDMENEKDFCSDEELVEPSCKEQFFTTLPTEDPFTTTTNIKTTMSDEGFETSTTTTTEKSTTTTEESTTTTEESTTTTEDSTTTTEESTTTTEESTTTTEESTTTTEESTTKTEESTTTTEESTTTTEESTTTTEESETTTEESTTSTEESTTTTEESTTTTEESTTTTEEPTTTTEESTTTTEESTTTTEESTTTTTEESTTTTEESTTTTKEPTTTTEETTTTIKTTPPTTTTTEKSTTTTTTTEATTTTEEPTDPTLFCKSKGVKSGSFKNKIDPECISFISCFTSNGKTIGVIRYCEDPEFPYFDEKVETGKCVSQKPENCI